MRSRFKTGDSIVHHSLWAESPSGEGNIWRECLSKLIEVENPVLIHYGSFETVFLKRMRQRYGAPPNGSCSESTRIAYQPPLRYLRPASLLFRPSVVKT